MKRFLIRINNCWARRRLRRVTANRLLLLAPHCLQRRKCNRQVLDDMGECVRCGACDLPGLLKIRDRFGIRCLLVSGGRQALAAVKSSNVGGVIAVACEPELIAGIRAAFPKPVMAIPNLRPEGPCRNTRVDIENLERTLCDLIGGIQSGASYLSDRTLDEQPAIKPL